MAEQDVVVVIRLSDVNESDQPDPLSLRAQDLSKWRCLEILLRNMYKDPPQAISVTYLDNEDDWIQISCDEELAEAIRIIQQSDNMLLFQVKRLDPLIYFESTLTSPRPAQTQDPLLIPEEDFFPKCDSNTSNGSQTLLVYPHPPEYIPKAETSLIDSSGPDQFLQAVQSPSCPSSSAATPNANGSHAALIYPYPQAHKVPNGDNLKKNENVHLIGADGKTTSIENRPDLSTQEKIDRLKSMNSMQSFAAGRKTQGLNSLSAGSNWEQAASLPSKEKLNFLKRFIPPAQGDQVKVPSIGNQQEQQVLVPEQLVEPLNPDNGSTVNIGNHDDPFETMPPGKLSANHEQVHLPEPTLTPLRAHQTVAASTLRKASDGPVEINRPVSDQSCHQNDTSLVAMSPHDQVSMCADKMRIGKTLSGPLVPPVPMPRTLQMMEGAQSGANAVAIEIPESYNGATHKEEDVTASGGTSCTSASAETGETAPDGIHHAAAVGREMKTAVMDPCAVSAMSVESRTPSSQSKKQSSESKKKVEMRKLESRTKRKESTGKEPTSKKKSSLSEKNKKETGAIPKQEDKPVKADVESGEKTVSVSKGETCTQYREIVKYMKKMKKELHTNIVKDVTKQTDKLIRKNFERSMSHDPAYQRDLTGQSAVCHTGVFCDSCNSVIYGIRFKCGNCPDFDLCSKCEALPSLHDPTHIFLKVLRPVRQAGVDIPLLRENLYLSDSISDGNSDEFTRLSPQSSVDVPVANPNDEEMSKWFWDAFGTTCRSSSSDDDSDSFSKLSKTEMTKFYQMLSSQPDLIVPQLELSLSSPVDKSRNTSVNDETAETTEPTQAEPSTPVDPDSISEESEAKGTNTMDLIASDKEETEYVEIDNGEDESEAEAGDFEEASVSLDENFNVMEDTNSANGESDSSEDFCVIDPPSREDFETCGMEFSAHSDGLLPRLSPYIAPENLPVLPSTVTEETGSLSFCPITMSENTSLLAKEKKNSTDETSSSPSIPVEDATSDTLEGNTNSSSEKLSSQADVETPVEVRESKDAHSQQEAVKQDFSAQAGRFDDTDGNEDDCLMKMSPEERQRFMIMVETLKTRSLDLEKQLKKREGRQAEEGEESKPTVEGQREQEVQRILAAKRKEAVRENERLEKMNMKEVAEKLEKWQSVQSPRHAETIILQQEKLVRCREQVQSIRRNQQEKDAHTKSDLPAAGNSPASSVDGNSNPTSQQTDSDCQTNSYNVMDPTGQATQMLQHLTQGMSKAASSAFYTAKDVIYALQAKQLEKKTASRNQKPGPPSAANISDDSWTPPAAVWTLPKDESVPPKSEQTVPKQDWTPIKQEWTPPKQVWTPPKQDWTPPKQDWTPPKQDWTPPKQHWRPAKSNWAPPADETKQQPGVDNNSGPIVGGQQRKEANRPTPSISAIPRADSALQQEATAMQRLMEMGFANREQNRKLLQQFNGDLEKVVQSLLQEEVGDHWASHRH